MDQLGASGTGYLTGPGIAPTRRIMETLQMIAVRVLVRSDPVAIELAPIDR